MHINVLELEAVLRAVRTFWSRLAGRQVQLATDSQVVFHLLRSMRSPVDLLYRRLRTLFYVLDTARIILQPRWIPTETNTTADSLSREADREDWTLWHDLFLRLEALFGPHSVDRFATVLNHQCLQYNSRWHDIGLEGDALRQSTGRR